MNAIIIEDEQLIARELQAKIAEVSNDIKIIEVLPSLKTAKRWLMNNAEPDMMFMDIQLSDGISFELFDTYKITCPVIFTTAYDEYALRAFKVNGVDYLLKPIDEIELAKAIEKCRAIVASKSAYPVDFAKAGADFNHPENATIYKEKFIVSRNKQWIPVKTSDIAYFTRDAINYLYTFTGEYYPVDFATLDEVEELLDPKLFYRANRQYIVHVDSINTVKPMENQKLTIKLKEPNHKSEIDISREKAPTFKKWLNR